MSAQLALDLDHDAIRLLSRQSDGWVVEAVAELSAEDFTDRITKLRTRAEDLAGPDPAVTLVLPRSQVLYTSFEGETADAVPDRLNGITPYAVSEITWDTVIEDGRVKVAAVAHETLEEAVQFASSSRFEVIGLTSEPPEGLFPRLPVFSQAANADAAPLVLAPDTPPERSDVAFSSQRSRNYGPRAGRLHLQAPSKSDQSRRPAAVLAGLWASVPKPALGAAAAVVAGVVGFALWPTPDPDPLTKRSFDQSFTALPTALRDGLSPPSEGSTPSLNPLQKVAFAREAPSLSVPLVIGTSGIETKEDADLEASRIFAAAASLPLPGLSPVTLAASITRPNLSDTPPLGPLPGIETAAIARTIAIGPRPLPPAPLAGTLSTLPVAQLANSPAREPMALAAAVAPAAPDLALEPLPVRFEPPTAPQDLRAAPSETDGYTLAALPPEELSLGTVPALPEEEGLIAPLPDMAMTLPAPGADSDIQLGSSGFVDASPEGTPNPDGVLVFAGAPVKVAPARPVAPEPVAPEVNVGDPALAAVLPRARPVAATPPGTVAVAEAEPPEAAEPSAFESAQAASLVPRELIAEALAVAPETAQPEAAPPPQTVLASSLVPRPRPVRSATTQATRAVAVAPRIPSSANVAREATIQGGIRIQRINLIGVYGAPSDRRALVRLPSGKFIKLQVGDRLDGGQVAQIGADKLVYRKGGRNLSLALPNT